MGILHRDISSANIMITVDGRGRLIDLDLAREVYYSGAHQTARAVSSRVRNVWGEPRLISGHRRAHGNSCRPDYYLAWEGVFMS